MILNHINLTVTDVPATKEFFEKYFGLTGMEGMGSDKFDILRDDNEIVMTLMQGAREVKYPGSFHIGFIQPSREKVDAINARLKSDGYEVNSPSMAHGSWTFYMDTPGGFKIEVLS